MYTDPGHLRVQDPGKIEGNTVFTYLDAFCRPEHFERYLPDYPNLAELKAHYQRGGLGDVKVKRFLNAIMQETLEPIRNRRKEFSKDIPAVYEMLQKGCEVARAAAAETLADVKKAMKINYFDDKELIEEQVKRFSQELTTVFPQNTDEEKECFDLLCRSYIEARYNKDFSISQEQLEYLIARIDILKDITERLCKEKIVEYDTMTE